MFKVQLDQMRIVQNRSQSSDLRAGNLCTYGLQHTEPRAAGGRYVPDSTDHRVQPDYRERTWVIDWRS